MLIWDPIYNEQKKNVKHFTGRSINKNILYIYENLITTTLENLWRLVTFPNDKRISRSHDPLAYNFFQKILSLPPIRHIHSFSNFFPFI